MTLVFEDEQKETLGFDVQEVANSVIAAVLDMEQCPYEAEVELILTDSEAIRNLNCQHRSIDRETDVLSFPMVDYPAPASFDFLETEEGDDCFNPDSGELMLGDIVICVPRVIAQAKEYGHSVLREYAFLVAHSMLHLLGYDHMTPEEASVMEKKQEEALGILGITRDL
ncbi:MAG: rRNA maturation RNase YbeY [Lachnospiraceae bacterium]|nr:rRNA maturation RNase YbeY [Lachnospiraceae bacterium]